MFDFSETTFVGVCSRLLVGKGDEPDPRSAKWPEKNMQRQIFLSFISAVFICSALWTGDGAAPGAR